MTVVAAGFLYFVYYFDWMIYGRSKFTLVKKADKTECKSRPIPVNESTVCGAQDLNSRVKVKLDDSYFVLDFKSFSYDAQNTRCRALCLETNNFVHEFTSSNKLTRSIRLGDTNILIERSRGRSFKELYNRLVFLFYG